MLLCRKARLRGDEALAGRALRVLGTLWGQLAPVAASSTKALEQALSCWLFLSPQLAELESADARAALLSAFDALGTLRVELAPTAQLLQDLNAMLPNAVRFNPPLAERACPIPSCQLFASGSASHCNFVWPHG